MFEIPKTMGIFGLCNVKPKIRM